MKESPYKGKKLEMHEIYSLYQVLKFYYDNLIDLPPSAIADIMKAEFSCEVTEKDVYLYLFTVQASEQNKDSEGNIKYHD